MPNKTLYILGLILCIETSFASTEEEADTLFARGRHSEAYEAYSALPKEDQKPIHLIRMAYIEEARQEYPKALYHLMEHYLETQDARTWDKITELSRGHQINGYVLSEWERLSIILLRYIHLIWGVVFLVWCYFLFVLWRKKPQTSTYVGWLLLGLILLALLERQSWMPKWAVILEQSTLHKGPSAAAPQTGTLPAGTLLKVRKNELIWTSVLWQSEDRYIRTQHLGLLLQPSIYTRTVSAIIPSSTPNIIRSDNYK